jgi:hypothetical protein
MVTSDQVVLCELYLTAAFNLLRHSCRDDSFPETVFD